MVLCPAWSPQDWFPRALRLHNGLVTITYPNGTVLNVIVLSHDGKDFRVIAPGSPDVLAFTRIRGTWISEDLEPVTIEFEWKRREPVTTPRVEDCVCSKELATHLIQTLFTGCEPDRATEPEKLFVNPEGQRVAVTLAELQAR